MDWEAVMIVSKMRSDINEIVDFEKLKKCNDICFKWSKKFKVKKMYYAKFMWKVFKNPKSFLDRLKPQFHAQFLKDCKNMFYAAEVEEILINQYSAMVVNIMKRMRIQYNNFEDYLNDGYMAIRSAVWQYRTYKIKASFTTYAHRSVFMRIRGILHKQKLKRLDGRAKVSYLKIGRAHV